MVVVVVAMGVVVTAMGVVVEGGGSAGSQRSREADLACVRGAARALG